MPYRAALESRRERDLYVYVCYLFEMGFGLMGLYRWRGLLVLGGYCFGADRGKYM